MKNKFNTKLKPAFYSLIILILVVQNFALSQNNDNIPTSLFKQANTAKDAEYLSEDEKQVVLYMNLARLDGEWFIKNVLEKYDNGGYSKSNVKSLKRDLLKTNNLQALHPSPNLTKSARYHAKDMGKLGKTGHRSSDGTGTFKRIRKYAQGNYMAENCSYGYKNPVKIVLQLLVDDNVPSLGHRHNILNANYKQVGVAIEPHKTYRFNCVQDFSD